MTSKRFAKGQILFREGDPANGVFRLLSGAVEVLRDLGGDVILLGTVRAGQFIGEMGVVENRRQRSATLRAATDVEVESSPRPSSSIRSAARRGPLAS
jgi:CRP-like cAMP-binding protein